MRKTRAGIPNGAPLKFLLQARNHHGPDCLIWPYSRMGKGYAKLWYEGKDTGAHRLMCTWVNGPPPTPEHEACHTCGHGFDACIAPDHLIWATPKENAKYKLTHDTHNRGERHGLAKLTNEQVREIKTLLDRQTMRSIAHQFSVSESIIHRINSGECWSSVV